MRSGRRITAPHVSWAYSLDSVIAKMLKLDSVNR
ncbi:hypothetical protein ABIB26_001947 [Arthrobacter sp. UYEF20]